MSLTFLLSLAPGVLMLGEISWVGEEFDFSIVSGVRGEVRSEQLRHLTRPRLVVRCVERVLLWPDLSKPDYRPGTAGMKAWRDKDSIDEGVVTYSYVLPVVIPLGLMTKTCDGRGTWTRDSGRTLVKRLDGCDLFATTFVTKENTCSCVYITVMRERHLAISLNRLTEKRVATEWRCQVLLAVHRTVMRDGRSVLQRLLV